MVGQQGEMVIKQQGKQPVVAPHIEAKRRANAALKAQVLDVAEEVFDLYVAGQTFAEIAAKLDFEVEPWKLRQILCESEETADHYSQLEIIRSHNLVDETIRLAREAAALGDAAGLRTAIDTHLKVAGKLNSAYNDKASVEHTGKNGGAIEIVADLSLTAEQAYERLIRGD